MENKLRVGIIGAGANTRHRHIPGLRMFDDIDITSVCNRSLESSERAAAELEIPRSCNHWREITDDPEIDAVLIGTWPYLHCPVTIAALEHGKHVLCEARMAMNSTEARAMHEASKKRPDLVAMVVPSPFTLHVDTTIRRLISQGYFGSLITIDARVLASDFPSSAEPLHWRVDRRFSGNNILSIGIWYEALMRWAGEARTVYARGKTIIRSRNDSAEGVQRFVTIPDYVDIVADMYCGAQLHMQVSSVARNSSGTEIWLYGTDGVLLYRNGEILGMQRGESVLGSVAVLPDEASVWRVEEEFVEAVRGREQVRLTTFEDGVKYMEFTDAVSKSIATGREVYLPLDAD